MINHEKPLTGGGLRWGRPPVPFLALHVAAALLGRPLPSEIQRALGTEGASAIALSRPSLVRLPTDEAVLDLIARETVSFAQERISKLLDLPLAITLPASPLSAVRSWPVRSRNVMLRHGLAANVPRLQAATIGTLLDERMVGIQTALEVTALLEVFASGDDVVEPIATQAPEPPTVPFVLVAPDAHIRLGKSPAPLLPSTLRRAFASEVLPLWLTRDLHLPSNASVLALDASIWKQVESVPARVIQFVATLISYREKDIRDTTVLTKGWDTDVDPSTVDWPTRVRNALTSLGLMNRESLSRLTFGDLFAIPSFGAKSVLEFAVIAETLTARPSESLDASAREAIADAARETWAELVGADDVRFRDVVPPYHGTLRQLLDDALDSPQGSRAVAIAEALPTIRRRIDALTTQPFDSAIHELLKTSGVNDRDVAILERRMGWDGREAGSLQQIGDEFGITRERVRQLVSKVRDHISPAYIPALERSIQLLQSEAPIPVDAARDLLVSHGLATVRLHPSAVRSAANAFGYEVGFDVIHEYGTDYVAVADSPDAGQILAAARRHAGKVGVSNVAEVQARLEADGVNVPLAVIQRVIGSSPRCSYLLDQWFWMPGIPPERNRLRNVTRRILAVATELDLGTIRQGIRRLYSWRQIDLVPPTEVLRAFYNAHPEFVLTNRDTVASVEVLDYRAVLGDVERILVEVLAPRGLMDRGELEAAVTGRGVNASTFGVMTTYSPILDHPALNVWCLRGQRINPAEVAALQGILSTRTRGRRRSSYRWQEDGTLSLTIVLTSVSSPVISIPHDISRYVAGRRFKAVTSEGIAAGVIATDEKGLSWGYGPFLGRFGAEAGDVLNVSFDLATEHAQLSLSSVTELEEAV